MSTCEHCGKETTLHAYCSLCHRNLCVLCTDKYLLSDCSPQLKAMNLAVPRPLSTEHTKYIRGTFGITEDVLTSCPQCIIDLEEFIIKTTFKEDLPLLVNIDWVYRGTLYRYFLSQQA